MARPETPRVVAIGGSLRAESRTRVALDVALAGAREAGADASLLDLREFAIPSRFDDPPPGPDVETLRSAVDAADGLLLGTPNYHGSYSGALKDALDHCDRETVGGTTVGLLEVAAGDYPGGALAHLRTVCRTLHAWTLPHEVAIPDAHRAVTADGVADSALHDRLVTLGRAITQYAGVDDYPAVRGEEPLAASTGGRS